MKIETRFGPRSTVWCIHDNVPQEITIAKTEIDVCTMNDGTEVRTVTHVSDSGFRVRERCCFTSKAELRRFYFGV